MTIHTVKIAVHSAKGCCTATTMALTSINQKLGNMRKKHTLCGSVVWGSIVDDVDNRTAPDILVVSTIYFLQIKLYRNFATT